MDRAQAYIRDVRAHYPSLMAKGELDQHFLASDTAIERELAGLNLKPRQRVAELGAGIGSVAQAFPRGTSLTLVELDPTLCQVLKGLAATRSHTQVVEADALQWIKTHQVEALLCNLPWELDKPLFELLGELSARMPLPCVVVAAIHPELSVEHLQAICNAYAIADQGLVDRTEFWPSQELPSRLIVATLK